jgi:hypothetical protein
MGDRKNATNGHLGNEKATATRIAAINVDVMTTATVTTVGARGCTGELSRAKAKKSFGSTYTRKIEAKKNVTKHNSCHPQNWRFPLSTMVANIYL